MREIDLRSDTVTKPTEEMRKAIAGAEVGDDVYSEDPTVNRLQKMAAEMLGHEAGLYVPSGTMGNQVAINVHTDPGDEVILEEKSHIYNYEMGIISAASGAMPRPLSSDRGLLDSERVREEIRPDVEYLSDTTLLAVENTHNNQGGRVYCPSEIRPLIDLASEEGLSIHLDGARVFNAAVAQDLSPEALTGDFDSVMFCLSKGLGAPVGSVLVGDKFFIEEARVARKRFGGGLRQVGILAAAGVYALENHVERLDEDHRNAARLAEGLERLGFAINPNPVESNIFFVRTDPLNQDALELADSLESKGIRLGARDSSLIRIVTHLDISTDDVDYVLEVLKQQLK